MQRGKKYREALSRVGDKKTYLCQEGLGVVAASSYAKFDETIDVAIALNVKKGHSIRGTVVLPHPFVAKKRILVLTKSPEKAQEAKEAGATYVGEMEYIEKIKEGWLDFDICVATPGMMKDVGKLGPILGRRGLMPNPKAGTVTNDLAAAVGELLKGRVEYRADKVGVVHMSVGKLSMDKAKVEENFDVLVGGVVKKKPSDVKGEFVKSIFLSSTMGPSVRVSIKK